MRLHAELNQDDVDLLSVTFSGHGCTPSWEQFMQHILNRDLQNIVDIANLRYECAVSGAMRWPWSQEALIRVRVSVIVV